MNKFKVGDKVECIKDFDLTIKKGMRGTVVDLSEGIPPIGVSWKNFSIGHNCNKKLRDTSGYYVYEYVIKLSKINWRKLIKNEKV